MIVTLITPRGGEVALDDPDVGFYRTGPVDGVGMPPTSTTSQAIYNEPGEWFQSLRYQPRSVHVPIAVVSDLSHDDLVRAQRRLLAAVAPSFRPGFDHRLRFTLGDGSAREIYGRYDSGWSGHVPQYDFTSSDWIDDVLTFRCSDPMFYDVDETVFAAAGSGGRKYFPMFADAADVGPHFSSSNVFSDFIVTNAGDMVAWPIIRVDGPGTDVKIISDALGTVLDLGANGGVSLNAGEYIVIDTRPGYVSVTRNDGTNLFNKLSDDSTIWPIAIGTQTIRVNMGGTTPNSNIEVRFKQRYTTV